MGGENRWKYFEYSMYYQDILLWRGQFVGVVVGGGVNILDFHAPEPDIKPMGLVSNYRINPISEKYLVDLDGNLLLVWRLFDRDTQRTSTVEVMQLDYERRAWAPIDELSGHSLFLGTSHSMSLSSSDIPGLKDNLIYFTGDWCGLDTVNIEAILGGTNWNRDVGAYDMRKGTYDLFPIPNSRLPPCISTIWFAPLPSELQNGPYHARV